MSSNNHPPKTPPRHLVRSRHFTPSYMTPQRTPSTKRRGTTGNDNRATPITPYRLSRTPYRDSNNTNTTNKATSNNNTPFYTPRMTPSKTPINNMNNNDGDRFVPSRNDTNIELCRRALLSDNNKRSRSESSIMSSDTANMAASPSSNNNNNTSGATTTPTTTTTTNDENPIQKEHKRRMLSAMCGIPLEQLREDGEPGRILSYGNSNYSESQFSGNSNNSNNRLRQRRLLSNPFDHDVLRSLKVGQAEADPSAHIDVAKKALRKVPSAPTRILDAPDIVDDYYLNLISWSKDNILAVALAHSVYLWNGSTGGIQHLVTLGEDNASDYVTSVTWCRVPGQTRYIAVGTNASKVLIYDGNECRLIRTLSGHRGRVSSMHWNNSSQHSWLSTGSRDSLIINHDVRTSNHVVSVFRGHEQEVCGLKWNDEGTMLASGGNENFLCIWDAHMTSSSNNNNNALSSPSSMLRNSSSPRLILRQHKAAVKALDWCPFHRGLLASGGGTADRCVKFWNSSSGAMINSVDTGSQVCSVVWSKHQRELCTSHGYSENQLILWKYPSMMKIKELKGHTSRVLNMEMSPDGTSVVSAAADETLRFWNVFGSTSGSGNHYGGYGGSGGGNNNYGNGDDLFSTDLSFLPPIR